MDCTENLDAYPILGQNFIATQKGDPSLTGLCNLNESMFQQIYNMDIGTTINSWPSDDSLINQAYDILWDYTYHQPKV